MLHKLSSKTSKANPAYALWTLFGILPLETRYSWFDPPLQRCSFPRWKLSLMWCTTHYHQRMSLLSSIDTSLSPKVRIHNAAFWIQNSFYRISVTISQHLSSTYCSFWPADGSCIAHKTPQVTLAAAQQTTSRTVVYTFSTLCYQAGSSHRRPHRLQRHWIRYGSQTRPICRLIGKCRGIRPA